MIRQGRFVARRWPAGFRESHASESREESVQIHFLTGVDERGRWQPVGLAQTNA